MSAYSGVYRFCRECRVVKPKGGSEANSAVFRCEDCMKEKNAEPKPKGASK